MNTRIKLDRKLENLFVLKDLFELKRHKLTDSEIYNLQSKKLQKLMKRAYEIPFYRRKFAECGMKPENFKCREDLVKFPLLKKSEIKEWISSELQKNPEKYSDYHIYTTSGSTGTPLKLCASPKENAYFAANWLRIAMENGVNPFFDKTMALKDPAIVAQGNDSIIQKLGLLRRHKVSFLADGWVIADELNKVKPDFFYAHRTKLMQTIEYAKKSGIPLHHPKVYASTSETLTEQSIELFHEYLGNGLFTSYGCMETGACTYTRIGETNRHIVTSDTHVINIVDDRNQLADSGRMIITNLFLKEFPIINYDIGDGGDCFWLAGVMYIKNIRGRMNDWIILEDGRRYDYHPFYAATERIGEVFSFRVIQEDYHHITLELVSLDEACDKSKIEGKILDVLTSVITDYEMIYHFEWKKQLETDANGKLRFIVNRINH